MRDFRENCTFRKSRILKISQFDNLTIGKDPFLIIEGL